MIRSPSRLKYNMANVSGETRELVETVFEEVGASDPPKISLESCRIREAGAGARDGDGDEDGDSGGGSMMVDITNVSSPSFFVLLSHWLIF